MISKAIIPAAGLGTRFLPITKALPKEMLPLLNKPAIQYIVEEGMHAGIKNFIMVTSTSKQTIHHHFQPNPHLEQQLILKQKEQAIAGLKKILKSVDFTNVHQYEPSGLGHAVWSARHAVGKELVSVMLPDDIFTCSTAGIGQLMKIATQEKCNVVAVKEVPSEQISRYGVVAIKKQFSPNLFQVKELVEKPSIENAPSNLAIVGRYVLSPTIFDILGETQSGAIGEIQLTDAIQQLIFSGEKVFAYKIQGTHYDLGTPLGWLKSNLSMALKHPAYSQEIMEFLSTLDKEMLLIEGKAEALNKQREL